MIQKFDELARHRSAADALLRIVVFTVREQARSASAAGEASDLTAMIADPVNAPCLADLRRIGLDLATTPAGEDMTALMVQVAEMDAVFAGWRAAILEAAWAGIGGSST